MCAAQIFLPAMGLPGRAQKLYTMPMSITESKEKRPAAD